jgi:hypothetical protein
MLSLLLQGCLRPSYGHYGRRSRRSLRTLLASVTPATSSASGISSRSLTSPGCLQVKSLASLGCIKRTELITPAFSPHSKDRIGTPIAETRWVLAQGAVRWLDKLVFVR